MAKLEQEVNRNWRHQVAALQANKLRGACPLQGLQTMLQTYSPVTESGLGALYCLGCEVYGRWGEPSIQLVEALVRERTRMLHPRVRRGTALGLQHRWWGILSVSLQKAVARAITRDC